MHTLPVFWILVQIPEGFGVLSNEDRANPGSTAAERADQQTAMSIHQTRPDCHFELEALCLIGC